MLFSSSHRTRETVMAESGDRWGVRPAAARGPDWASCGRFREALAVPGRAGDGTRLWRRAAHATGVLWQSVRHHCAAGGPGDRWGVRPAAARGPDWASCGWFRGALAVPGRAGDGTRLWRRAAHATGQFITVPDHAQRRSRTAGYK